MDIFIFLLKVILFLLNVLVKRYLSPQKEINIFLLRGLKKNIYYYIMKCEICNYETKNKQSYDRHLKSKGHFKKIKASKEGSFIHECTFCEKKYLRHSSLWRHKKTCKIKLKFEKEEELLKEKKLLKELQEIQKKKEKSEETALEKMKKEMEEMRKQLAENKTKEKELLNTISTLAKNKGNTQNNTFNIQVFLDEKCKNAMPIMDFIRDLQFKLTDINPERPSSTIESLSKCITDKLEDMDETERPVHCTDEKRLVFHVKDASGWTKDINNKKIDKAIDWANMRHQGAWIKKATSEDMANQKNDLDFLHLNVAMGKFSDDPSKAKRKIKRAIAKNTYLPKNWSLQKSPAV